MSIQQWLVAAAWAFMPVAAAAQVKQNTPDPLDANAPAVEVRYESAFKTFRSPVEERQTPDKVWRSANEEMGKLGGHMGHMQSSGEKPQPAASAGSAPPAASGTDHSKHH